MSRFYTKHKSFFDKIDGLFLGNTVLERGLVVAPVIVAATSLKNSVVLAIAYGIITFFTVFFTSFVSKKLPYTIRVIIYVLFASLVYIPTEFLLEQLFEPLAIYNVGIFLPLMVANSLIVRKSETRFFVQKKGPMVLDLLCSVIGFMWVICLVGAIRELFGNGTIWNIPMLEDSTIPGLLLPFSGFIVIGFIAAGFQKFRNYFMEQKEN